MLTKCSGLIFDLCTPYFACVYVVVKMDNLKKLKVKVVS